MSRKIKTCATSVGDFFSYMGNEVRLFVLHKVDFQRYKIERHIVTIQHAMRQLEQATKDTAYEYDTILAERDALKKQIDATEKHIETAIQTEVQRRRREQPETLSLLKENRNRVYEWLSREDKLHRQNLFFLKMEYETKRRLEENVDHFVKLLKSLCAKYSLTIGECRQNLIVVNNGASLGKIKGVKLDQIADDVTSNISKMVQRASEMSEALDDAKQDVDAANKELNKMITTTTSTEFVDAAETAFLDKLFLSLDEQQPVRQKMYPPTTRQQHIDAEIPMNYVSSRREPRHVVVDAELEYRGGPGAEMVHTERAVRNTYEEIPTGYYYPTPQPKRQAVYDGMG
jgi:hypothetical protein